VADLGFLQDLGTRKEQKGVSAYGRIVCVVNQGVQERLQGVTQVTRPK